MTLHIPGETYGFGGPLIGADGNVYQATRTATTGTSPDPSADYDYQLTVIDPHGTTKRTFDLPGVDR